MPTLTKLKEGVLAVTGLPEDAKNFTVIESHAYFPSPRLEHSIRGVNLPPGSWKVLGWSTELTEGQCESIVDISIKQGSYISFVDYCFGDYWHTAAESFASLLRSHSLTEKALIIVNKEI